MSPPTDGVALYKIRNDKSSMYATLVDNTPHQFITQSHDMGSESQIWQVSYDAETGIATIKNLATGNYATVDDLTYYVVGDTIPREFELYDVTGEGSNFIINLKNSDRVWHTSGTSEGDKLWVKIYYDSTDPADLWSFVLQPGVVSEGEGTPPL
ncbi:hypothetical protein DEU56DRAFT_782074 [Suillus clintonianus]|uniref:uncharacterized protein n=1 Tax=Suillus clintonianus TaxID=1904413 RepID=UPI001B85E8C2|nr:uncharacterized protein DEU56DRAFT_782074 [Suillus clintonianus]KAG2148769.1 hypothetical protein DEU56DRAFT_782074 [Suillus clintonianus]